MRKIINKRVYDTNKVKLIAEKNVCTSKKYFGSYYIYQKPNKEWFIMWNKNNRINLKYIPISYIKPINKYDLILWIRKIIEDDEELNNIEKMVL